MALIVHVRGDGVSLDHVTSLLRVHVGDAIVGLPATVVREIARAVTITALPGAPQIIEGAVNVRGQVVPVVDVRRRLAMPAKDLDPDEFLVVFLAGSRTLAFRADDIDDLVDIDPDALETSAALSPALHGLAGLAAREDGVLVIYDPEAFVSQGEAQALDAALLAHQ